MKAVQEGAQPGAGNVREPEHRQPAVELSLQGGEVVRIAGEELDVGWERLLAGLRKHGQGGVRGGDAQRDVRGAGRPPARSTGDLDHPAPTQRVP